MDLSDKTVKTVPDQPAFIVLDLPSPVAEKIRRIRGRFDPKRVMVPAEITLTGSCGLGGIVPGQSVSRISSEIGRIAGSFAPFSTQFDAVERFPNTSIYFFTLKNEEPFRKLHEAFAASSIRFRPNAYPYKPHCTLMLRVESDDQDLMDIFFQEVPRESFRLEMMSFYTLPFQNECELLYKCPLTGK